jgi:hypothetical protein
MKASMKTPLYGFGALPGKASSASSLARRDLSIWGEGNRGSPERADTLIQMIMPVLASPLRTLCSARTPVSRIPLTCVGAEPPSLAVKRQRYGGTNPELLRKRIPLVVWPLSQKWARGQDRPAYGQMNTLRRSQRVRPTSRQFAMGSLSSR